MPEEQTTTVVENADEVAEATTPETEQTSEKTSIEDTESEAVEIQKEETTEEVEKPKVDLKQRKIAKQARELREMKRQNANLARAIEEQSKAVSSSQKKSVAPKIEDFEDMNSYLDARDDYRDSKRETPKQETNQDYSSPRDDLSDAGAEKYEDFEDVVFSQDVKITQDMANAIFEIDDSELQVDVAYYLGNNPKEASKIAKLSKGRQIAEIAKLEMKVTAKPAAKKQVSKAPAPIKPVGGAKTTTDGFIEGESFKDFLKKRHKQLGRT